MFAILAGTCFVLSGCGERMEGVCVSKIRSTLMNPETAEFHDFRTIEASEYVDSFLAGTAAGSGQPTTPTSQAAVEVAMHNINKQNPESTYHSVRVRAEGKLGNKITSQMICMADKGDCACSDPVRDAANG